MSLVSTILFHGRLNPNRPAIMLLDRVVSYGMLAEAIGWMAARLHMAGVRPGDVAVAALDNPIRQIAAIAGLLDLGAVAATAHPEALARSATASRANVVLMAKAQPLPFGTRAIVIDDVWFAPPATDSRPATLRRPDPGRLAVLAMTSGTTGEAKVIGLTHGDVAARIANSALAHRVQGTMRELLLIGLASQWGLTEAFRALSAGRTVVFTETPEQTVRAIDLFQIEAVIGSPQQFAVVMDAAETMPALLSSVRIAHLGGAIISETLGQRLKRWFRGEITVEYGSTEAGCIAVGSLDEALRTPGSAGFIVPNATVEIVDAAGTPRPPGEEGIIRVMAPAGGRPHGHGTLTPDRTPDWFIPGDTGVITEDGRLIIRGRTDELINVGGFKVAPETIEALARGLPGLVDCAAFGRSGASGIDDIWLAVAGSRPLTEDTVIAWCRQRSADFAPARVLFVDRIPRNAMGKPERLRIKASFGS